MKWSPVFLGGARVVVMPTTVLLVLFGAAAGGVLPALLLVAASRAESTAAVALVVLALAWAYAVNVLVRGAVAAVAADDTGPSFADAVDRALRDYGSYLGASALLLGVFLTAFLALAALAQLGRIAGAGTLLLALLTPVLALIGSAVVLVVPNAHELAFAAVSVERAGPFTAVKSALALMRRRRGEVLLWVTGTNALLVGLFLGVVLPVVIGFYAGNAALLTSLFADRSSTAFGYDVDDSVVAVVIASVLGGVFLWTVFGLWASFVTASAVHFRRALAGGAAPVTGSGRGGYCEGCGTPLPPGAAFCEGCGARVGTP